MTTPASSPLSASDRALLLAFLAWRVQPDDLPWNRMKPAWSVSLKTAWDREFASLDPEQAWSSLKRLHISEAVFDVDRVHPSWLVRALQGESPSVVRAIIANSPEAGKARLCTALGFDSQALIPDGPTHPDALTWSQSFWAERLVGGAPIGPSDPPVIVAIAGLSPKELARLIRTIGLARLAMAENSPDQDPGGRNASRKQALFEAMDASSAEAMPAWTRFARNHREANPTNGRISPRNLGLLTLAFLLSPRRSRAFPMGPSAPPVPGRQATSHGERKGCVLGRKKSPSATPQDRVATSGSRGANRPIVERFPLSIGPLQNLPPVDRLQARRKRRQDAGSLAREALRPLTDPLGLEIELGDCERIDRAAGLGRPGMVAHFSWPRFDTRLALWIETPLAHAAVDRLLGFWRFAGQDRLQITPVEWGLMGYVAARALGRMAEKTGPLGAWDLILDRVSPESFNPKGLGPIVTLRWVVRLGDASGSARLWASRALLDRIEMARPPSPEIDIDSLRDRFGDLSADFTAEIGTALLTRGLGSLRVGGVLPISGCNLSGTPGNPSGRLELISRSVGTVFRLAASPIPNTGGARITVQPPLRSAPNIREPIAMSDPTPSTEAKSKPAEVPVTLAIELGRVSLTLSRLADLREGDVIELGRHPQEPVELTSGGRLVARGELVQIDTELGVRLISVFL